MDKFGNLKLYPDRPTIIAEAELIMDVVLN